VSSAPASSVVQQRIEVFTSTTTWTAPAGVTTVTVFVIGGGGGGVRAGSATAAGGNGGMGSGQYTVTPGTSYTITVGTGGAGGYAQGVNSTATSSAGVASSFSSFLTANGGGGSFTNDRGKIQTIGAAGNSTGGTLIQSGSPLDATIIANGRKEGRNNTVSGVQTYSINAPGNAGGAGVGSNAVNSAVGGIGGAIVLMYNS
jgi:hypothetical protein